MLPRPFTNPIENDLSRNALPYATALAGACPHLAPAANVLPPEFRRSNSRAVFIPTAILGVLVLLTAGSMLGYSAWSEKQYVRKIHEEIARVEPARRRAEATERQANQMRARAVLLDEFRAQTRKDLDAFNELTRLIEPPAWTTLMEINRDTIRLAGEAPQASPLPRILDSSPLFERTEMSVNRGGNGQEGFQIRVNRRVGK